MNQFLFKLYFLLPVRFRGIITKVIIKKENGYMYSPTIRAIYKQGFNIDIGYGTYGGCFNLTNIPSGVIFGNYCSIASNIKIFRANHPKENFTSHPLLYNPIAGYVIEDKLDRPRLHIGNDVWIGEWTIILPKVKTIGDGAIIGAGSIVTKNVEPYTIIAGNPAIKIGKRFNDDIIDKIIATKWYRMQKKELISNIDRLNKIVNEGKVI